MIETPKSFNSTQREYYNPKTFENSESQKRTRTINRRNNYVLIKVKNSQNKKKKKTITWEKENRSEVHKKEEFNMLNPIKKVKSIFQGTHNRKTNFNSGQGQIKQNRTVHIELITTSVFLGYNQIRSISGINSILEQVNIIS